MDQWDHITSNIFIRNVVRNGYALEFVQKNAFPLSRVPIAFKSTRVISGCKLLNDAISKLLEKGAIECVEDERSPSFYR